MMSADGAIRDYRIRHTCGPHTRIHIMISTRLPAFLAAFLIMTATAFAGGTASGARLVHPNPFSDDCTFTLTMPSDGNVRIIVFDLLGRQVANLTEDLGRDYFEAGTHPVYWNGKDRSGDPVPAGTYVCVLYAENGEVINSVKVVKMIGIN
jgi:hypothetical protein